MKQIKKISLNTDLSTLYSNKVSNSSSPMLSKRSQYSIPEKTYFDLYTEQNLYTVNPELNKEFHMGLKLFERHQKLFSKYKNKSNFLCRTQRDYDRFDYEDMPPTIETTPSNKRKKFSNINPINSKMKYTLYFNNNLKKKNYESKSFRLAEPVESKKVFNLKNNITQSESMKDIIHSDRSSSPIINKTCSKRIITTSCSDIKGNIKPINPNKVNKIKEFLDHSIEPSPSKDKPSKRLDLKLNYNKLNILDENQGSFEKNSTRQYLNLEFKHESAFNEITRDSVHPEESHRLKSNKKKKRDGFGQDHIPTNENTINILDDSQSPFKSQSKSQMFLYTQTKQLDGFECKRISSFNKFTRDYNSTNDVNASKDVVRPLYKQELGDKNMHYNSTVSKYVNHSDAKNNLKSTKLAKHINQMNSLNIITGNRKSYLNY